MTRYAVFEICEENRKCNQWSTTPAPSESVAQVVANGARGLAAGTAATAEATALVPAGADEVSAQAAMAFATEGVEMNALNTFAQEELARAGAAYIEIAGIYTAVDGAAPLTCRDRQLTSSRRTEPANQSAIPAMLRCSTERCRQR